MNTLAMLDSRPPSEARVRGSGLVSVSTSRTDNNDYPITHRVPDGMSVVVWASENVISIDRQMSRVTRLRKGVGVAAKALHNMDAKANKWMVTLTYAGDNRAWNPKHMSNYIAAVKMWFKREHAQKLRYVWVAELQERGVIHYHAVFWLPRGVAMPKADKCGWWAHGMTKTEVAVKPIGYLMSYLSKIETKNVAQFPTGARIFGIGGLDKTAADCKRWILWPSYLQSNVSVGEKFRPAKGGGFVNADTGEFYRSEYAPTGGGFKSFIRVFTHDRKIEASGPFSWAPHQSKTVH